MRLAVFRQRWKQRLRCAFDAVMVLAVRVVLVLWPKARRNSPVRRSLWAGTPIVTLPLNAAAERRLGIQAETLVFQTYYVTDRFDRDLSRWMRWPVIRSFVPYCVLLWAGLRYQRFHVFHDRGLLPSLQPFEFNPRELQLLHRLGKEIYFWTYGADVRTRKRTESLGRFHCCTECPQPGQACVCDDQTGRRRFERIRRQATAVFSMGDMTEYTPGSVNDLFFWPIDLRQNGGRFEPHYPEIETDRPVRVVHAPNHRAFKGTRFLLDAVERMQADGLALELRLVEGLPNDEALAIYRSADLVFDQCLIGFHGYFALEAMAMGKPVLTYIRKREYLLAPEECPLVSAPADRVETKLRELAADRRRLHSLGVAGRKYVERHFTVEAFAARLQSFYQHRETGSHESGHHRGGGVSGDRVVADTA